MAVVLIDPWMLQGITMLLRAGCKAPELSNGHVRTEPRTLAEDTFTSRPGACAVRQGGMVPSPPPCVLGPSSTMPQGMSNGSGAGGGRTSKGTGAPSPLAGAAGARPTACPLFGGPSWSGGAPRPILLTQLPGPDRPSHGPCPLHRNRRCLGRGASCGGHRPRVSLGPPCDAGVGGGGRRDAEGELFASQ